MSEPSDILFVEDDENDVFFLRSAFTRSLFNVRLRVARDGQEAIDYLSGQGKFAERQEYPLPCLMILDLKMPRKTGMDVLRWRRDQTALNCVPVIVLSSSAHRYDVERAYLLGANAFVAKPSSVQKRDELVKLIGGFWLTFNEPPLLYKEGLRAAITFHEKGSRTPFTL